MKTQVLRGLELFLFFVALAFVIPPVPSNAGQTYRPLPAMIIGVVILLCSLLLARKRGSENLVAILLKMLFYLVFLNYERVFSF
ncbi:MAG: hypothetical protein PHY43_06555 [Verrucomicrobiales bacterium]|nr:hypothetical protein [Verrucomicrobiales bacterium]